MSETEAAAETRRWSRAKGNRLRLAQSDRKHAADIRVRMQLWQTNWERSDWEGRCWGCGMLKRWWEREPLCFFGRPHYTDRRGLDTLSTEVR